MAGWAGEAEVGTAGKEGQCRCKKKLEGSSLSEYCVEVRVIKALAYRDQPHI